MQTQNGDRFFTSELDELHTLYQESYSILKQALPDADSWNDIHDKRITFAKLLQSIYQKGRQALILLLLIFN